MGGISSLIQAKGWEKEKKYEGVQMVMKLALKKCMAAVTKTTV